MLAGSAAPEFRTITIGKGSADGLRPDMAVLAPAGVVGRVIIPSAGAAKVQLLVDRNAAVGALVERSRSQGVVLGAGNVASQTGLRLGHRRRQDGDSIVTSGIDGIYPKGFLIGKVVKVDRAGGAYRGIDVRPAVDFSRLEDVLVVLSPVVPDTGSPADAPPAGPTPATPAPAATPPAPRTTPAAGTRHRPPDPRRRHSARAGSCAKEAAATRSFAGSAAMKVVITALAVVVAVLAQGQLGGALVLGTTPLDLGLIAVVYIALTSGPTVGLLAGMCAGLAQDALGGGIIASKGAIIGIGGLANTVVGFLVGQASTQFIVTGALPRFVAFFGSTVLHAVIFMGLYELLGLAHFGLPWGGVLGQGRRTRWSAS